MLANVGRHHLDDYEAALGGFGFRTSELLQLIEST
jgi:hypothetical protein